MIKRLFILLLFLSSSALAAPIHYSGGTFKSGVTAVSVTPKVTTTISGVSQVVYLPNENLVYFNDPELIHYLKDEGSLRTEFHCDGNAASDNCGNESGTTTGWTPVNLGSGNSFYASTTIKSTGNSSLAANANVNPALGERFFKDIGTDWSLITGNLYKLTFDARHHGVGATWVIILNNVNNMTSPTLTIVSLTSADTTFSSYSINFIYDSNYRYLVFGEISANTGGVYVDNLSITEQDPAVNRGMGSPAQSGVSYWYRNPDTGLLTHCAANEICVELHAGIYSIPMASATTNYATRSELFSSGTWVKTRSSVTAGATDPRGATKAFRLGEDQSDNSHFINVLFSNAIFADNVMTTFSFFAQADTRNWIQILINDKDGVSSQGAYFDLSTGTIGTIDSGVSSAWISEKTYGGFYRIAITLMSGSGGDNITYVIALADADTNNSYQGDGVSGLTIFGAMASEDPSAMPYLPSEGSIEVWAGNAGALTYSLNTMEAALDGTVSPASGTTLWGEQLGIEIAAGALTVGNLYKISADNLEGHWFGSPVSSVTGMYFVELSGTTTADSDNKVQQVLNPWNSGDGHGLEPPHFTLIQAVRHTYNRAEIPADAKNHGYLTTRNDSANTLIYRYQNGLSLVSFDAATAAQAAIEIVAHSWSWLVLEVGKLNSNVSQFRLCEISGGLSCGAWADYDGDYNVVGDNLVYFYSGFGLVYFGPTILFRSHLDSTFYDSLGGGG